MSNTGGGTKNRDQLVATFEYFARLPPELRLMVWEELSTTSRCIDVWPVSAENDEGFDEFLENSASNYFGPPLKYRSHNPVPAVLHVCQEARYIGLKYYELSFGYHREIKAGFFNLEINIPPQIYANFECDIICPVTSMPLTELCERFQEDLTVGAETPIQRIALPITKAWNDGSWHNWDMIHSFLLKEIILYAGKRARSKTGGEPFHPAKAAPPVMELISLTEAKESGKISSSEYKTMTKRLKKATGTMVKEIGALDNFSRPTLRRPVISTMYLDPSAQEN